MSFGYAQLPVSATLNYRFRLRSTTGFGYAQLPVSATLNYRFRLGSTTDFGFAQLVTERSRSAQLSEAETRRILSDFYLKQYPSVPLKKRIAQAIHV